MMQIRRRIMASCLAAVMLFSFSSCDRKGENTTETPDSADTSPSADTIIEKIVAQHLEALGGHEANRKQTTRRLEGSVAIMGGTPGKITVTRKAPNLKHSMTETPGSGTTTEGYDGKVAWQKTPGQAAREFSGEELKGKARDARFYGSIELITAGNLTYEKQETYKGKAYHVLKPEDPSLGGDTTLYIDEKTYLMGVMKFPVPGILGSTEIAVEMGDYRAVDGIQIPFSITVAMKSTRLMTIKWDKVTHGIDVDDTLFAIPGN